MMSRFGTRSGRGRYFSAAVRGVHLCLFTLLCTFSSQAQEAQDWLDVSTFQKGGANDITAIQNAIDTLGGQAGTIYFPAGDYDLYSSLSSGDRVSFIAPHARFIFHDQAMFLVGDFDYNFDLQLAVGARALFDAENRPFGRVSVGVANAHLYPNWFGVVADDQLPDNKGFNAALESLRLSPYFDREGDAVDVNRSSTLSLVIPGGRYILDAAEFTAEDERIGLDLRPYFKPGWTIEQREKNSYGLVIDAQNALFTLKGNDFVAVQMGFHTKVTGSLTLAWEGDGHSPAEVASNGVTGVRFGRSGDLNTGAYIEHVFINDCQFGMVFTVDGCQNLRRTVNSTVETLACGEDCGEECDTWRCNPESGVYYNHVNHARIYRCATGLTMRTTFTCNEENGKAARVNANHFDFLDIANSVETGIEMDWANSNSFSFLELERNGMITADNATRGRGFWLKGEVSGLQVAGGWIEKNGWDKSAGTDQEVNIQVAPNATPSGLQIMARMTGMYKTPSSIDGADGLGLYTDGSTLYIPTDTKMTSVRLNEARDMRSIRSDNGLNVVLRNRKNMEVKPEGESYLFSVDSSPEGHPTRGVHIPELLGEMSLKPNRNPFNPSDWLEDFRLTLAPETSHFLIQNDADRLLLRLRSDSGGLYVPGNVTVDGGLNFRVGKGLHESYKFVVRAYGNESGKDGDPILEIDKSGLSIGQGQAIKKHLHQELAGLTLGLAVDAVHILKVPVTGAMPGDTVAIGLEGAVGGLMISGSVVAENEVEVTLFNKTGEAWSVTDASLKADIWQH